MCQWTVVGDHMQEIIVGRFPEPFRLDRSRMALEKAVWRALSMHIECDHCGTPLARIFVQDPTCGGKKDGVDYTVDPESLDAFPGKLSNKHGTIRSYMCPKCRRVHWFGHGGETSEPVE